MNADTFEKLYEEAYPKLNVIASAIMGNRNDSADVVQQAALVAVGRIEQFSLGSDFTRWMAQIVRNVAQNERRKKYRTSESVLADPLQIVANNAGEDAAATIEYSAEEKSLLGLEDAFDDHVTNALNELPEATRTCLLLRTVLLMQYGEIGELLDLAEGTVASHVHRAKKSMVKALAKNNQDSDKGEE